MSYLYQLLKILVTIENNMFNQRERENRKEHMVTALYPKGSYAMQSKGSSWSHALGSKTCFVSLWCTWPFLFEIRRSHHFRFEEEVSKHLVWSIWSIKVGLDLFLWLYELAWLWSQLKTLKEIMLYVNCVPFLSKKRLGKYIQFFFLKTFHCNYYYFYYSWNRYICKFYKEVVPLKDEGPIIKANNLGNPGKPQTLLYESKTFLTPFAVFLWPNPHLITHLCAAFAATYFC